MPYTEVTQWFGSRKHAQLDGVRARPKEHPLMPGEVVVIERGQAGAVILSAENGAGWILKKFHQGRCPNRAYLSAVGRLLPRHDGFRCGNDRRVLSRRDLKKEPGCYYSLALERWVEDAVLMPRVAGVDWATVADSLRDGTLHLDRDQRLALCRAVTELIQLLEASGCAHRDLSSGNVFVDTTNWRVLLIDFDSVYHPNLRMPAATTCGTEGYAPPFVWRDGKARPEATWCPKGDRFALALLNAEFLVLDRNSPLGAEGGMFDQRHLGARSGTSLRVALDRLNRDFPDAVGLFNRAVTSQGCAECPGPEDWILFCDSLLDPARKPPPLSAVEAVTPNDFMRILQRRKPAAPVWPAPRLADIPWEPLAPRSAQHNGPQLPGDPWTVPAQLPETGPKPSQPTPKLPSPEVP